MFLARIASLLLLPALVHSGTNDIVIDQSGADLGVTVEQNNNGTMNEANIIQLGTSNKLLILQQFCIGCSIELQQSGTQNYSSIYQIDATTSSIVAIQQGDGNIIDVSTEGRSIELVLSQHGSENSIDMVVSAADSSIEVNQEGVNNTLTVTNIESASKIQIDQIGNGNSIEFANGRLTGHSGISVTQMANGVRITISQYSPRTIMNFSISRPVTADMSLTVIFMLVISHPILFFPGGSLAKGIENNQHIAQGSRHVLTETDSTSKQKGPDSSIDVGIIVDNTKSPFGHELARQVSSKWLLSGLKLPAVLTIHERQSPLKGSLIEMSLQQRTIFSRRYRPRRTDVDILSNQMVSVIMDRLLAEQFNSMSSSPDLAESEL